MVGLDHDGMCVHQDAEHGPEQADVDAETD